MLEAFSTLFFPSPQSEESLPLTALFLPVKALARKIADRTATTKEKEEYTNHIAQIVKDPHVSREDRLALARFVTALADEMAAVRHSAAPR
jgi:hypothetical protein